MDQVLLSLVYLSIGAWAERVAEGDSFHLSLPQCALGGELRHILADATEVTVAARDDAGVWKPSAAYADRLERSDSGLVLARVNCCDSGAYVFTCSGYEDATRLRPTFTVFENGTASLWCPGVTKAEGVKSVKWKRNEQYVVRMNVASLKILYGAGLKKYVSVPPDWSEGNFARVDLVQLHHQGDYFCVIEDTSGNNYTYFVGSLTVKEASGQSQTNATTQPATRNCTEVMQNCTSQPGPIHGGQDPLPVGIIIAVVALALVALVAFGIWWIKCRSRPAPMDGEAQQDVQMDLIGDNR